MAFVRHTVFGPKAYDVFPITMQCFCHYHTMFLPLAYDVFPSASDAVGISLQCRAHVVCRRAKAHDVESGAGREMPFVPHRVCR